MSVQEDESAAELWWHLHDTHGLGLDATHGDPGLMHAALHSGITPAEHDHTPGAP
jgi:hypothetical protein